MHSGGDLEAVQSWRRRLLLSPVILLAAVVLPCSLIYLASTVDTSWPLLTSLSADITEEMKLRRVLSSAAMADKKTVILTTVNSAWISPGSVVDLFMESFKVGNGTSELLDHLVVVAMDEKGYVRCMELHKHCFALTTEGVDFSEQKNFMSGDYLKMMWRRLEFLGTILDLGFDFIFSDTDIMWFRNPLPHFYKDGEFQIACDYFVGNPNDLNNRPNGGFMYVKSNNKTISFFKYWFKSQERHPGVNEQEVLNLIKKNTFTRELGVKMRFLDTTYFGGFCESSKDFDKVCTMHANCCIGLGRKLHDLGLMLDDWRRYMSMTPEERQSQRMAWSVPKNCSLAPLG
ncbi:Nucleotide-diphospho-sugar transferases protein [Dioscorea alata]|uniref:Nucleotide-diphospho-sugar transferases protein n=1 Tax=Dioscorea alata TaxID=55571 RepID=A0ACB7V6Y4_DIOAL|nr:Nucleotide-diphospho-sugar transferases protein [Dioscorea alata]